MSIDLLIRKALSKRILFKLELEGRKFEQMVGKAIDDEILLMLTLDSRKVYIGRPYRIFPDDSRQDRWVGFLPWKSGYRADLGLELTIATDYERALGGEVQWQEAEHIAMSIPLREIVSCQFFDPVLYSRFRADQLQESEKRGGMTGGEGGGRRTNGELISSGAESDASQFTNNGVRCDKEKNKA